MTQPLNPKQSVVSATRISSLKLSKKLTTASALMLVSGILVGILGYVCHIIVGRLLTMQEYGLFTAMLAVITIASVPVGAIGTVISRQASEYCATDDRQTLSILYCSVNRFLLRAAAVLALLGGVLSPFVRDYFHLESIVPALLFLLAIFLNFISVNNSAHLQALQRFNWVSVNAIVGAFSKIIFCAGFVAAGFGLTGAILGITLAYAVAWMASYFPIHAHVPKGPKSYRPIQFLAIKSVAPVFLANLAFVILTQLDSLLVVQYFNGRDAGIYVAAAVLGKAIMYLPSAIVQSMFPMVAENEAMQRSSAHLFIQALLMTLGLGTVGALLYFFFSNQIMALLYGQRYAESAVLLRYMGFAMLPMALITVAEYFLMAKKRVLFAYLMLVAAPIQILLIAQFHSSLMNIIWIISGCGWGLVIVGFGMLGLQYVRSVSTQS